MNFLCQVYRVHLSPMFLGQFGRTNQFLLGQTQQTLRKSPISDCNFIPCFSVWDRDANLLLQRCANLPHSGLICGMPNWFQNWSARLEWDDYFWNWSRFYNGTKHIQVHTTLHHLQVLRMMLLQRRDVFLLGNGHPLGKMHKRWKM